MSVFYPNYSTLLYPEIRGQLLERLLREMTLDDVKYYVALDLGSDSMVAAFHDRADYENGTRLIPLQEHAEAYVNARGGQTVKPLLEREGNSRSPRLKTRISLVGERQPRHIEAAHAGLEAVADARADLPQSIFRFFHVTGGVVLQEALMPNPKIPFQLGAREVFPTVKARGGGNVLLKPDVLLKHLTAQVLRSFVLSAQMLENVEDPATQLCLLLTIPNVYSLSHKQALREFLIEQRLVGQVEIVYESDAVAYSMFTEFGDVPPDFERFKREFARETASGRQRLLTVDVGRGTTDLSLIEWSDPLEKGGRRRHETLARTGKSEGGNTLSHLFARYYQAQLRRVLKEANCALPFSLLAKHPAEDADSLVSQQRPLALAFLERLIENVKREMSADLVNGATAETQGRYLKSLARAVTGALKLDGAREAELSELIVRELTLPTPATAAADDAPKTGGAWRLLGALTKRDKEAAKEIAADAAKAVVRGARENIVSAAQELKKAATPAALPAHRAPDAEIEMWDELLAEIRAHIERSVVKLIGETFGMAQEVKSAEDDTFAAPRDCWVLVAGQASQFAPLRAAIEGALVKRGIGANRYLFLNGPIAKYACCLGAIEYESSGNEIIEKGLFGTYGILTPHTQDFTLLDNAEMRSDEGCEIEFDHQAMRQLVFTTGAPPAPGQAPNFKDGRTAILASSRSRSNRLHVKYDPARSIILFDDDEVELATYGNTHHHIWAQVWPDMLPRKADLIAGEDEFDADDESATEPDAPPTVAAPTVAAPTVAAPVPALSPAPVETEAEEDNYFEELQWPAPPEKRK